ncbi:MAG: aminopeptidase [Mycoplasmatales bacterium]
MNIDTLKKYANMLIKSGLNVQKDQILFISAPVETYEFVRIVTEAAYAAEAKKVVVNWGDEPLARLALENQSIETLSEVNQFTKDMYDYYVNENAAFLSISGSNPDAFDGIDSDKMNAYTKALLASFSTRRVATMGNKVSWTVASVPTKAWAQKVFPDAKTADDAVELLWEQIIKLSRANGDDPVANWQEHITRLEKISTKLNDLQLDSLHFTNSLGTDLVVGLAKKHIWETGGSENLTRKTYFSANIPTEEVFTLPDHTRTDGVVVSSKPLNDLGNLVNNFKITFKDGKAIDCSAETGESYLKNLIAKDEGASSLGEVALVPHSSPISQANLMFYTTLYDENASCHLALGAGYPTTMKDSENMTKDELYAAGCNQSMIHVDFMFGTSCMKVVGTATDGTQTTIMENGEFVI